VSSGRLRAAVVGAGAGGLAAARRLRDSGHDVTVFELGSRVGGLWVYENDNGRSPAYASLRINSEARVTAFDDVPFDEGVPLYPTHSAVAAYLHDFAVGHGLLELIRFRTGVDLVERGNDGRSWRLSLSDGSISEFDLVVVATGHQDTPAHPPFAADFMGDYLHSHEYRVPEPFAGRRVLVVGVGNSGLDIASDICTVTSATTLSARSPVLIMPRMLCGMPLARILAKVEKPWLPWPVARRIRVLLSRIAFGTMEQWGFATPRTRTHPAGHPTVMGHIAWERISVRQGVARVVDRTVHFTDGSSGTFDALIAATGYEVALPFLPADLRPVRGREVFLYRRMVPPGVCGLYFVGYFNVSGGANIRMMDVQAKWLAAVVDGRVALPDEASMRSEIDREKRHMAKRFPASPRYGLELEPRPYERALIADLDTAATDDAMTASPDPSSFGPGSPA